MLSKTINYHPILVGVYAQWLVSNSGKKKDLKAKSLASTLKDSVDKLLATSYSTTKNIIGLKTTFAVSNKAG